MELAKINQQIQNRNVYTRLLLFSILTSSSLILPIRILFLLENSVTMSQVSLLKVIFALTVTVFELPTGIIADKLSKRLSISIGSGLFALHAILYVLLPNFLGFIITQLILGLAASFISGADTAYLSSYISKCDPSSSYIDIRGRIKSISSIVTTGFSVISAILYAFNPAMNFIITFFIGLCALFVAISLPPDNKEADIKPYNRSVIKEYYGHAVSCIRDMLTNKLLVASTLFTSTIMTITIFNFEYYQVSMKTSGIPSFMFGAIYASFAFIGAFGNKLARKMLRRNKASSVYVLFSFLLAVSFFLFYTRSILFLAVAVILQQLVFSGWGLVFENDILENVESEDKKSTFSSINNLLVSVFKTGLTLMLSLLLNFITLNVMYVILAMIVLISVVVYICSVKMRHDNG